MAVCEDSLGSGWGLHLAGVSVLREAEFVPGSMMYVSKYNTSLWQYDYR